eukprot:3105999-Rhodomonas_salina.2
MELKVPEEQGRQLKLPPTPKYPGAQTQSSRLRDPAWEVVNSGHSLVTAVALLHSTGLGRKRQRIAQVEGQRPFAFCESPLSRKVVSPEAILQREVRKHKQTVIAEPIGTTRYDKGTTPLCFEMLGMLIKEDYERKQTAIASARVACDLRSISLKPVLNLFSAALVLGLLLDNLCKT